MKRTILILIALLLTASTSHAAWMFAFSRMEGGQPKQVTMEMVHGWVLIGQFDIYGAYLFSGSAAQLIAVDALTSVVGICKVTVGEQLDGEGNPIDTKWPELNDTINPTVRTKINNYLTSIGKDYQVPADATNAVVIKKTYKYFRDSFDGFQSDWVKDQ